MSIFRALLPGGDCILPFNWLLELHVEEFEKNGASYDWKNAPVCPPSLADALLHERGFFSKELAAEQLAHARQLQVQFEMPFDRIRPEFEEIFRRHGKRVDSFAEFRDVMCAPGGVYWAIGSELYRHVAGSAHDEEKIRQFVAACPPFHALLIAYAREKPLGQLGPALPRIVRRLFQRAIHARSAQLIADERGLQSAARFRYG